ncbi:protein SAAL1 isoform X2 [Chionomys nivalis]|uniref:protein SAAL1 isoform X2 n=1 Tax=Chionomys nivalis TaxID=269649 RepID=UPI00259730A2|nr:protein SAAL1 isoform X2 [Chionomys nivalis]
MDRNPSPPPPSCSQEDEEDLAGGDCIGSTVYSKHWLFGVLSGLIQIVTPESAKSGSDDEQQMELTEETENEICRVWDMSMDEDVALFLQEFKAPDIFMGVLAKSRCPRLREICVGILGNMACFREICVSISSCEDHGQVLLQCLCDSDPPTLLETSRLLLTCLSQAEVASVWVERIREHPSIYASVCFIMSSSTNGLKTWKGLMFTCTSYSCSPQQTMGFKQLCPDTAKETWNLLFDLVCHEFCQVGDPPIILQEQKTVLASVFSVMSAISASWAAQEHPKREEVDLPLIDSLIRVLQNMEHCQKKPENSTESDPEEPTNCGSTQDEFHMKILKDISCEFLSNIFQELSKETVAQGLKEGQLNKEKCSCAFQSLLPLYSPVVEDFVKVLREVDKALAEDLEDSFPSVKAQT